MLSRALARSARSIHAQSLRAPRAVPVTPRVSLPVTSRWTRSFADKKPSSSSSQKPSAPKDQSQNPPQDETTSAPESAEPKPDFNALPDLTQGIPSTLDNELKKAAKQSQDALAAVEEEEQAEGRSGRPRGEMPASAYESSTDRKRMRLANRMYIGSLGLAVFGFLYLGRDFDDEEAKLYPDVPNGWMPDQWWARATARTKGFLSYYNEPPFEKLLPDPDPMFSRPYTLCISLEDMLVHSEWSREHGWRIAKRPGVDYFLRYLSQYYELVLFTSVPFANAEPLVRKLDPFHIITWPLFREATKYEDGQIVKDLSYLNRDLSKVIILDTKASHVRNQPENAILLDKWTGDSKDKELVSLIPLLEYIFTMDYQDVRKVLKSFDGKHIPTEFARRESLARAEFNKRFEQEKRNSRSGIGALGSAFGLKGNMSMMTTSVPGEQSTGEAFAQGKMLQDIARERGQRSYEMLEAQIRENGEKWLKEEQEAQEKAQSEAMKSMGSSLMGWFLPSSSESSASESSDAGKK